jgi:hypothetical protein
LIISSRALVLFAAGPIASVAKTISGLFGASVSKNSRVSVLGSPVARVNSG